jgi:hypothetical protein
LGWGYGVAQVVEFQPSKHKALSSNSSTTKPPPQQKKIKNNIKQARGKKTTNK